MIKARIQNKSIQVKFPYNSQINDKIKSIEGCFWNKAVKCWQLPLASLDLFNGKFGDSVTWVKAEEETKIKHSTWSEDDIDITVLDDLKLKPYAYQMVGGSAFLPTVKAGLLADEVGLGKTFQVFIAFQQLYNKGKIKKAMIFCKKSLCLQWLSELEKFTNLNGIVIAGDKSQRRELYEEARDEKYQFVFLNYELLIHDYEEEVPKGKKRPVPTYDPIKELVQSCIDLIVIDEVQKIKNYKPEQTKKMRRLRDLVQYRWGLSGTPLENSPEDVFNIMYFINPKVLGQNPIAFRDRYLVLGRFGQPLHTKNLTELNERISPYMLRRRQDQVDHEFPDLKINEVLLEMSELQAKLHNEIRESIYNEIKGLPDDLSMDIEKSDQEEEGGGSVLGKFVLLMQISDSPALLLQSDSSFANKVLKKVKPSKTELAYSPKYDWIQSFIQERKESNPKAKTIIFSRYERVVIQIKEILEDMDMKVELHTGKMSQAEREQSKANFWADSDVFISTDSGAEGLNLQCADVVINIDLPWNPSKFIQRWGRIKRAGSEHKKVRVFNLICEASIDERIKQIFYTKENMFNEVIDGNKDEVERVSRITKNALLRLVTKSRKKAKTDE